MGRLNYGRNKIRKPVAGEVRRETEAFPEHVCVGNSAFPGAALRQLHCLCLHVDREAAGRQQTLPEGTSSPRSRRVPGPAPTPPTTPTSLGLRSSHLMASSLLNRGSSVKPFPSQQAGAPSVTTTEAAPHTVPSALGEGSPPAGKVLKGYLYLQGQRRQGSGG